MKKNPALKALTPLSLHLLLEASLTLAHQDFSLCEFLGHKFVSYYTGNSWGTESPGEFRLSYLAAWPSAGSLTFLCLSFLSFKIVKGTSLVVQWIGL